MTEQPVVFGIDHGYYNMKTKNNIFNLRKEDKINQRVKKPVFMRLCGEVALGCEECLAA